MTWQAEIELRLFKKYKNTTEDGTKDN